MYNPAQAFIHIAKSLKTYRTSQNLSKSMLSPTLQIGRKIKNENTTSDRCAWSFEVLEFSLLDSPLTSRT